MVSLSSRRPIRESPRLLGAGIVLAIVLVVIGLLIGWATASNGHTSPAPARQASQPAGVARLQHTVAAQAAKLRTERAALAAANQRLALARRHSAGRAASLRRTRRALRCWRAEAKHKSTVPIATCLAKH